MSEFYLIRRGAIADVTAFLGFLVGFVGSAPVAWPYLQVGFQTGEITKGFAYFIAVIVGYGIAGGIGGLLIGHGAAWFWERGHRSLRRARAGWPAGDAAKSTIEFVSTTSIEAPPDRLAHADFGRDSAVVLREGGIDERAYARLLAGSLHLLSGSAPAVARPESPTEIDVVAIREELCRTRNIGAWSGGELVGVVRVATHDARRALFREGIVELVVDPAHRSRGVGAALLARALRVTDPV